MLNHQQQPQTLIQPIKLKTVLPPQKISLNLNLQELLDRQKQESQRHDQKITLLKQNIEKIINNQSQSQEKTEYYSTIFSKTSSTHTDLVDISQLSSISDFSSDIDEQNAQEENTVQKNLRYSQLCTGGSGNSTSISPRISTIFLHDNPFLKNIQEQHISQKNKGAQSARLYAQKRKDNDRKFSIKLQNCQQKQKKIIKTEINLENRQREKYKNARKQGNRHQSAYFLNAQSARNSSSSNTNNMNNYFQQQLLEKNTEYKENQSQKISQTPRVLTKEYQSPVKKSRFSLQNSLQTSLYFVDNTPQKSQKQISQSNQQQQQQQQRGRFSQIVFNQQYYDQSQIPQQQQNSQKQNIQQQQQQHSSYQINHKFSSMRNISDKPQVQTQPYRQFYSKQSL